VDTRLPGGAVCATAGRDPAIGVVVQAAEFGRRDGVSSGAGWSVRVLRTRQGVVLR